MEPLPLLAALLAGALNAVAGGGSFLTLPALVFIGVPPVAANATGTAALLPGYASAAWKYRHDLRPLAGLSLPLIACLSLIGGAAGAALLLLTPDSAFRVMVPWLILVGTALFALGPWLLRRKGAARPTPRTVAMLAVLAATVYGGYFNGGLGILLLALFTLLGETSLNAMNGLKNIISFLLTIIAVAVYAAGGAVLWSEALPMMASATLGGYLGAAVGRKIPGPILRWGIVAVGLIMALLFFIKG